jgi:hypothetical protein
MKKSEELVAVPAGVATVMRPDPVSKGTLVAMLVAVAEVVSGVPRLNLTRLLAAVVSKFVPVTVTAVPAVPLVGVKEVMLGAPVPLTVKDALLAAVPADVVTEIAPVVAPVGTVVTSRVALADVTVAETPLKVTVFWLGVVAKPVP